MLINKSADDAVHALNSSYITLQSYSQAAWHADDKMLITTIRDLTQIIRSVLYCCLSSSPLGCLKAACAKVFLLLLFCEFINDAEHLAAAD